MKSVAAIAAVSALVLACSSQPAQPVSPAVVVADIHRATVALIDEEGHSYCTGVWVSIDTILTAFHCVDGQTPEDVFQGQPIFYNVGDAIGRLSFVERFDEDVDLALLRSFPKALPLHGTASLSLFEPIAGEPLHFIGQTAGLPWAYSHGYASIPSLDMRTGTYMQVSATSVWKGNSGGGAFNEHGELVGLCHSIASAIPGIGLFVKLSAIKSFLVK